MSLEYETPVVYLDDLNLEGLQAVCICRHGEARSWAVADILNEVGISAKFIQGGFRGISNMSLEDQIKVAETISKVPDVFVVLGDFEVREFKNQINLINSKRERQAVIGDSVTSFINDFSS